MCVCVCVCVSICLSICLSIYLSIFMSVGLSPPPLSLSLILSDRMSFLASRSVPPVLQSSEIPKRLPSTITWNCSVPHWPRFQRHFHCNLRQECASGEDEVQCPYYPCSHGGVSFQGHCYFFTNCGKKRSWLEAHKDCREAGGYMASLTTAREWGDVNTWLSLDATWRHIFVGLTSVSPRLPHMCVDNGASSTCSNFRFAFPVLCI